MPIRTLALVHSENHNTRLRPRLSRTFSPARWLEYEALLVAAREHGYRHVSLERWVREGGRAEQPTVILRHDVDQHPRSALKIAEIELGLGVRSSWYLRWRTAHPTVIRTLLENDFEVGLHYETLSRKALDRGIEGPADEALIAESRDELRTEIATFARLYGPIRSVVPHGDSRVPGVHNAELLRGEDCSTYGVEFDANEAMRGSGIAYWLTDRTSAEGGWKDAVDPVGLLDRGVSPILCVTHPNNWASGPGLWLDRLLSAVLPQPSRAPGRRGLVPIRTGSDLPPG